MSAIFYECKQIFRGLLRSSGSTVVTTVILALGLALTIYMFGAIDGYFLRPLPFPDSKRLIHIEYSNPKRGMRSMAVPARDFVDLRTSPKSVESLAAFYQGTINVSGGERPERYDGAFVTGNTFTVLGVRPILGRLFFSGEDLPGAQPVVILGYDLWKHRYNADPSIIGKVVRVNSKNSVVVGVMPHGFKFPVNEDIWIPLTLDVRSSKTDEGELLEVFGKLRKGVSLEQARTEFGNLVARLARQYPDTNNGMRAVVKPYAEEFIGDARFQIYTMFGAVLLVLLIACANVANITVVKSIARRREFALRASLGAARWRLILQVLIESVMISLIAGAAAYEIATAAGKWTIDLLKQNPDIAPPYWVTIQSDWRMVFFATAIAMISGILAGLFPALRASNTNLSSSLHEGGHAVSAPLGRANRILVSAQIALSCVLLIAAGLMTRSILNIRNVDVGARTDHVLTGRIGLMESNYPDADSRIRFFELLREHLSLIPGVESATVSSSLPGSFVGRGYFMPDFAAVSKQTRVPIGHTIVVATNYFRTFEIPVVNGRTFDSRDKKDGQPVAIINKLLAEKWWPGQNPIGHRLKLGQPEDSSNAWLTIVGVVTNVQQAQVSEDLLPTIYLPLAQSDTRFMSVAFRTAGSDPKQLAEPLRKAVEEIDPDQPVYWVYPLEQWIEEGKFGASFIAGLFVVFAVVALVLAAAGQYALLAYTVEQRSREIGVRRALGALDSALIQLLLNEGIRQFLIAVAIGLPLAVAFSFLLSNQLFGVRPFDPVTFVMVPLALFLVSLLAGFIPTRRALKVDPALALRSE